MKYRGLILIAAISLTVFLVFLPDHGMAASS